MSRTEGTSDPDVRIPDPAPRHTPLWVVLSAWLVRVERWLQSRGGPRLRAGLWQLWGLVAVGGILLPDPRSRARRAPTNPRSRQRTAL